MVYKVSYIDVSPIILKSCGLPGNLSVCTVLADYQVVVVVPLERAHDRAQVVVVLSEEGGVGRQRLVHRTD